MLEQLPSDEAADILNELDEDQANEILLRMEPEASEEVRELMEYPDHTAGSFMTTDFISFPESLTVDECLTELRRLKPESEISYEMYLTDDEHRQTARLPLSELIFADMQQRLYENRVPFDCMDCRR